jgi:hypothetical protein
MGPLDRILRRGGEFGDLPGDCPEDAWLDQAFADDELAGGVFGLVAATPNGGRLPLKQIFPDSIRPPRGVEVRWVAGWEKRGAPTIVPKGITDHWTVSRPTAKRPWPSLDICTNGRPAGRGVPAVPAPLVPVLVSWPDTRGIVVVWMIASGRANHMGRSAPAVVSMLGRPLPDRIRPTGPAGSTAGSLIGVEVEHPGPGTPYPELQVEAANWVNHRFCSHYGWRPDQHVISHEEGALPDGRKVDCTDPTTTPWTTPGQMRRLMQAYHDRMLDGDDHPVVPVPRPVVVPPLPRPTVRYGSTGPAVVELQRLLGLTPNGQFGTATNAAVTKWQRDHGLTADGVVGPLTWAALLKGAA